MCGAGKSTVLNNLVPYFKTGSRELTIARPISPGGARTIRYAIRLALRATIVDPIGVCQFLIRHQGAVLFLKLGLRIASMEVRKARSRTLLVDSGVIQPIVSYLVEQNIRRARLPLHALMSIAPFPAVLIYVRVDPEIAYRRYVARQTELGGAINHQGLRRRFEDGYAFCEWFHDQCVSADLPTIVIETSVRMKTNQLMSLAEEIMKLSSS